MSSSSFGHGGMPIELGGKLKRPDRPVVVVDQRKAGSVDSVDIGYCGFASLAFDGPKLEVTYIDEKGTILLQENWVRSGDGGAGSISFCHPDLTNPAGTPLTALVS